jgi:3-oxoacyl-[acyl-carrier-protein] synthase II
VTTIHNTRSHPPAGKAARVFITGVGVVSSIGLGREAFFRALERGQCGIGPVTSFDTHGLGRENAGEVTCFRAQEHLTVAEMHRMGRCSAMALAAARMAIADANLRLDPPRALRTAVVIGTTMGDADILTDIDHTWIRSGSEAIRRSRLVRYGSTLLPVHVARGIGAQGMVLTLPAACAAGNYAVGFASDLMRAGRADVVVTGASDLVQELQFSGFVRLAAMAAERCQPFDLHRQGILLGEGAGLLVLESEAHAVRRGALVLAEVGGYGLSCDASHVAETKLMSEVFGARRVPISSVKSMLGHCMGAASALETIACLMTLVTDVYPPTIGYETPDPECDVDVVANVARRGKSDIVLNNSLAFGGYNAVTCFAKPGVLPVPLAHGS